MYQDNCEHEGFCCCEIISRASECYSDMIIMKLTANGLGLTCPSSEMEPGVILRHIRYCCEHEDFLCELARVSQISLDNLLELLEDPKHYKFVISLACLLTKEIKEDEIYDKLLNCIGIIDHFSPYADKCIDELCNIQPSFGIIDASLLQDFFACISDNNYIKRLTWITYPSFEFLISDLEKALSSGYELDDTVTKLCSNRRKIEEKIKNHNNPVEEYEIFIQVQSFIEYKSFDSNYDQVVCYKITYSTCHYREDIRNLRNLSRAASEFIAIPMVDSLEEFIPKSKVPALFEIAELNRFPVYICGRRTYIERGKRNKSARKIL